VTNINIDLIAENFGCIFKQQCVELFDVLIELESPSNQSALFAQFLPPCLNMYYYSGSPQSGKLFSDFFPNIYKKYTEK